MQRAKFFLFLFINALFLAGQVLLLGSCRTAGSSEATATAKTAQPATASACNFPVYGNYYRNLKTWIPNDSVAADNPARPYALNHAPIKEIELNFNIFQDSNGEGNFKNTPEDRAYLVDWVKQLNNIFQKVAAPTDPVPGMPLTLPDNDTRIRFNLGPAGQERIYFYQDDNLHRSSYHGLLIDKVKQTDSTRLKQLNILYTQGYYMGKVTGIKVTNGGSGYTSAPTVSFNPGGASATAVISDKGKVTDIKITSQGYYYVPEVSVTITGGGGSGAEATAVIGGGADGFVNGLPERIGPGGDMFVVMLRQKSGGYTSIDLMAHELGHIFGLEHSFDSYHCAPDNFLKDIYGNTGNCPHQNLGWKVDAALSPDDKITNNLMAYSPNGPKYISPMQAGILHRSTAVTEVKKYVGEAYSPVPYIITKPETWDFTMRLYHDLVLEQGGIVTLKCKLTLPLRSSILIKSGGKLVLDGGQVQPFTPEAWQGIEVQEGGVLELQNVSAINYPIRVKRGGTLILPAQAFVELSGKGKIEIQSGGYICMNKTAQLVLQDQANVVSLHRGSRFGVNTAAMDKPDNCISSVRAISFSGSGSVKKAPATPKAAR